MLKSFVYSICLSYIKNLSHTYVFLKHSAVHEALASLKTQAKLIESLLHSCFAFSPETTHFFPLPYVDNKHQFSSCDRAVHKSLFMSAYCAMLSEMAICRQSFLRCSRSSWGTQVSVFGQILSSEEINNILMASSLSSRGTQVPVFEQILSSEEVNNSLMTTSHAYKHVPAWSMAVLFQNGWNVVLVEVRMSTTARHVVKVWLPFLNFAFLSSSKKLCSSLRTLRGCLELHQQFFDHGERQSIGGVGDEFFCTMGRKPTNDRNLSGTLKRNYQELEEEAKRFTWTRFEYRFDNWGKIVDLKKKHTNSFGNLIDRKDGWVMDYEKLERNMTGIPSNTLSSK